MCFPRVVGGYTIHKPMEVLISTTSQNVSAFGCVSIYYSKVLVVFHMGKVIGILIVK